MHEMEDRLEEFGASRGLQRGLERVHTLTGIDARNFTIRSTSEMGDAAGRCFTADGHIDIREDVVLGTLEAANHTQHFEHVVVHEIIHQEGNHSEGLTELQATELTHTEPVEAYRDEVRHARVLREVIGDEVFELAREENAKEAIVLAFVRASSHQNVQAALEEGLKHWEAAA